MDTEGSVRRCPRSEGCHRGPDGWPCRRCVDAVSRRMLTAMENVACSACNGYYGVSYGQPVCPTCHAFLYANDLDAEINLSEERPEDDEDRDSGTEEPPSGDANEPLPPPPPPPPVGGVGAANRFRFKAESLSQRLALLTIPRKDEWGDQSPSMVDAIPTELLLVIFSFLDDISLYAVGNVCRRWRQIVLSQPVWQTHTRLRWPLFRSLTVVHDWFSAYSTLVESCFCLTCIYQMAEIIPEDIHSLPLREKRLGHDLRGLLWDPPEGIKAQPLDSSYYHWQATITGPVSSPYEGGLFYLYMKVPFNYPFHPPEVRFLTRIFHPNISRHGDVGIDSILQHNWVSGMTISTVLISIQSLLTDPFTKVCMEPHVGRLYDLHKRMFEAVARTWTWQFAMADVGRHGTKPKPEAAAAGPSDSSLAATAAAGIAIRM